jgi:PAS domain S-box-containing protein
MLTPGLSEPSQLQPDASDGPSLRPSYALGLLLAALSSLGIRVELKTDGGSVRYGGVSRASGPPSDQDGGPLSGLAPGWAQGPDLQREHVATPDGRSLELATFRFAQSRDSYVDVEITRELAGGTAAPEPLAGIEQTPTAPDTHVRFDREHRHIYVSQGLEPLTGLAARDCIGRTHRDLGVPADLVHLWEAAIDCVFDCGAAEHLECLMPTGRWVEWLLVPQRDQEQRVTAVVAFARDISDHKRHEQKLREARNYFESIIDNVPDPIYVKDREHRWVFANAAFSSQLGIDREELIGRTDRDFFDAATAEAFWEADEAVLASGTPGSVELAFDVSSRGRRDFVTKQSRWTDGKSASFVVGILLDVTERKRTLAALRRREALLEEAQSLARVGHFLYTPDDDQLTWSPHLHRLYGLEPGTPVRAGDAHDAMLAPGERDHLTRALGASRPDGSPSTFEYRIRRRSDDSERILSCSVRWRTADGSLRLEGTVQDVTELKAVEEALRKSLELHRMIADNVSDVIWLFDLASEQLSYTSPSIAAMAGYSSDEACGMSLRQLFTSGSYELVMREFRCAVEEALGPDDITRRLELELVRRDGAVAWVEVTARVLRDYRGVPREVLGVMRDVSARKSHEAALERARAQAEEASRLKSSFVSHVSHEIRTPLHAIIGFSELVKGAPSLSEARSRADVIAREAEVLLALVNDLLDHAKIEQAKLELANEPLELRPLLDAVAENARVTADRKQLRFELRVAQDTPTWVEGDALRLRQVLGNLLSNAVKFTLKGSVWLEVGPVSAGDGRRIRFSVTDTGIGIPRERQAAIFESFVQADERTTRKFGGTGLGTTISKQLVELMGGELMLVSQPNVGSTFWFELPLREPTEVPQVSVESAVSSAHGGVGHVLVAEDHPVNQVIVREHLESAGYRVVLAGTGVEAVRAAETHAFDLVLMDVNMPDLDGFEATKRLRGGAGPSAHAAIVGLTAGAGHETRRQCLDAGMNAVLTKPIRRDALLSAVAQWLAYTRGELSSPPSAPARSLRRPEIVARSEPLGAVDWALLREQFGNNEGLARTVLNRFSAGLPADLLELERAAQQGDAEELRKRAHRLKGSASSVAAAQLAALAGELEHLAQQGHTESSSLLARLQQERERLALELKNPERGRSN